MCGTVVFTGWVIERRDFKIVEGEALIGGTSVDNSINLGAYALCSLMELGKCDDVVRGTCSGYYDT